MRKNTLVYLLCSVLCFATSGYAQQTAEPCGTTEAYKKMKALHPEIAVYEKQLTDEANKYYKAHPGDLKRFARTTAVNDTVYYDIPVVFHIMHDYGAELSYLTDNFLFGMIAEMNQVYGGHNDLSGVIAPFVPYIGHSGIRFHLATVDPDGNPTIGITRHRTYLTFGGDDMAKMDLWSPANYYNIWFENTIGAGEGSGGGIVLAYATFPSSSAVYPYSDGVISRYNADELSGLTVEHETGHYFNLKHPWNDNGAGNGQILSGCGDDEVDDTPPTQGHFSTCEIYDTTCAINYYKIYTDIHGLDSLVNYPDTTNTQNIMDYSSCTVMFTKGQFQRMYAALNSNVANRNNLYDPTNLINTGVWADTNRNFVAKPDLKPIPDFNCTTPGTNQGSPYTARMDYFTFPGTNITFTNQSWRDTITNVAWTFSNGAAIPTSTSITAPVTNNFTDPGWVSVTMTATGNHTGDSTITWPNAVFVADAAGVSPAGAGYFQEFNPAGDRAKWPTFNYYNNRFRWQLNDNVGFNDSHSMEYIGFDSLLDPSFFIYPTTGTPGGDFDDMFTVPMDLSSFGSACNLDFQYSGATRSSNSADVNDSMVISYSVGKSVTWNHLITLKKATLDNKGASALPYVPTSAADWAPMTIPLPAAAVKNYVVFRFRYMPGNSTTVLDPYNGYPMSSGNNYYIDHINFSTEPASVTAVNMSATDIAVVPNPTNGDAYVVVKDANNLTAQIIVTDVTGKVVYTTAQQIAGNEAHILIPHSAITIPGMYLVQTTTGSQSVTKKLVVY